MENLAITVCRECGETIDNETGYMCNSCIRDYQMEINGLDKGKEYRMAQFTNLCFKAKTLKNVTRLWNWVDLQSDPTEMWAILRTICPFAFRDVENTNSIEFTY